MHAKRILAVGFLCALALVSDHVSVFALTGREIMDKAAEHLASADLRAVLRVETVKRGARAKERVLWVVVRREESKRSIFLDFSEPQEIAGLKVLIQRDSQGEFRGYMYIPEEGATIQIQGQDRSMDIGGTGLSVDDFFFLDRSPSQEGTLVKEEEIEGKPCYLVEVKATDQGSRLYWVSKDEFMLVRSRQLDARGKLEREVKVVRFFQSGDGHAYPREFVVTLPLKGVRTTAVLEHAVFGITIPDEIMDPKTFGTARWRQ
jgi:hypothetical protein